MVFYTFHPLFMVMCINALPVKCKAFHRVPFGFTAAFVLPPVRGSLLFKSLNLVFPRSEVKFSTARDASGSRVTLDAYLKKDPQPLDITTSLLYCLLFMAPLPLSLRVG